MNKSVSLITLDVSDVAYDQTVPREIFFVVVAAGVPVSLFRLWWIWWTGDCVNCGFVRKACTCPSHDHLMRPRR